MELAADNRRWKPNRGIYMYCEGDDRVVVTGMRTNRGGRILQPLHDNFKFCALARDRACLLTNNALG